jgi:hypothetical protein
MARAQRGRTPVRPAPQRTRRSTGARVRRSRGRRAGLTALGVVASGLVGAGVLVPELPRGAGLAVDDAASAAVAPAQPATSAGGSSVVTSPQLVVPVPAAPAAPSLVVPAPRPQQIVLPRPWVPRGVSPTTSPPPAACGGYSTPRRISPRVVPGPGSASVSWPADTHADVQGYRVRAVSQRLVSGIQPDPVTVAVGQVGTCTTVTAQVAGLDRGVHYVFWLEEGQLDRASGVVRYVQVGESDAVLVG